MSYPYEEEVETNSMNCCCLAGNNCFSGRKKTNEGFERSEEAEENEEEEEEEEEELIIHSVIAEFNHTTMCKAFSLGSLVTTALIGVAPSLNDLFSDYSLGSSYLMEGNLVWGTLTILLTFAPGIHWSTYKSLVIGQNPSWWLAILFMLSCLFFPIFLVTCKIAMLINHGPNLKFLGIWLTVCEMGYESIPQLCLQLYIIFKKPFKEASTLQLFVLATSFITTALGPTEWFLWSKQSQKTNRGKEKLSYESLGFKEKLPMLVKYLPFYIALVIFRVLSFTVVVSVFQTYSIPIYMAVFLLLFLMGGFKTSKKYNFLGPCQYWKEQSKNRPMQLPVMLFTSLFTTLEDYYQPELQFQLFWGVTNLVLVSIAASLPFLVPGTFMHKEHVFIQDPWVLPIICGIILLSGLISLLLFFKLGVKKVVDVELVPVTEQPIYLKAGERMITNYEE